MPKKKGFLSILGLLLTIAIISFICYLILTDFSKKSFISKNDKTTINRVKRKINDIYKKRISIIDKHL